MRDYDFIGIDVAKEKFDACLLQGVDTRLEQIFDNTAVGIKKFVVWVQQHTAHGWVGMEATGHYSEIIAESLIAHGLEVSIINPVQIKYFAKVKLSRNKNDKVDARVIAEYCKMMSPKPFEPRSTDQKELRELVQLEDTFKAQLTQLKLQLNTIQSAAAKKELKKTIEALEKRIGKLASKVKLNVESNTSWLELSNLLTSIKGFGFGSACRLLAYLPDIKFFESAKQLAAFIGVSPRQKESGKSTGKTTLSKYGNPKLRKVLYMPALCAKRHNTTFRPFVERLKSKGLAPKAIVGAMMRKLVHVIFGMLKHHTPFNPSLV